MGDLAQHIDTLYRQSLEIERVGPEFQRYLRSQSEIRCLFAGSGGFGHQSATVTLLKKLVDEYGFAGDGKRITVVYQPGLPADKTPFEKLAILLPGFEPNHPNQYRYKSTAFQFVQFDRDNRNAALQEQVDFGFTGAIDRGGMDDDYTAPLNTRYFLLLLPYLWENKALQICGKPEVKLDRVLGEFTDNFHRPPVSWDQFTDRRALVLKQLLDYTNSRSGKTVRIWPSYAIVQDRPILAVPPEELSAVLIAGVSMALRKPGVGASAKPGSAVILNFGGMPRAAEMFAKARALLGGGKTDWEQTKLPDDPTANLAYTVRENVLPAYRNRQRFLQRSFLAGAGIDEWVRFVDANEAHVSQQSLRADLDWAKQKKGRVVFLQYGSVAPVLFDAVFAESRLPPLFEGVGTASKQVTFGVPYLHLPRSKSQKSLGMWYAGDAPLAYPDSLGGADFEAEARTARDTATSLIYAFDFELGPGRVTRKDPFADALTQLDAFLGTAYDPTRKLNEYFVRMAQVRNDPGNDRFSWALGEFLKHHRPFHVEFEGGMVFAEPANELEQIWTDLRDARSPDGDLDVFAGMLAGKSVAEQSLKLLRGITGDTGSTLVLSNAEVAPEQKPVDTVTVTGEFKVEGFDCSVDVQYSMLPSGLAVTAKFQTASPWNLPGAPWLGFGQVGVSLSAWEATAPMQAQIFANGYGESWGVDLQLGGVGGWALEGKFDSSAPSTAEMFQLAAGTNFLHGLPGPLADFKVEGFRLVYQPATKSLQSVAVHLGSDGPWELIDGLSAKNLSIVAIVNAPGNPRSRSVSGSFSATTTLRSGAELSLGADFPSFGVGASLLSDKWLLSDLLSDFGLNVSVPADYDPAITEFRLQLDPRQKQFSIYATLGLDWTVDAGDIKFVLGSVRFSGGRQPDTFASITGNFAVGDVPIVLSAEYRNKAWQFRGHQGEGSQISILDLAGKLLPDSMQPPDELGKIELSGLDMWLHATASGHSEYGCGATLTWTPGPKNNSTFTRPLQAAFLISSTVEDDETRNTEGKLAASWQFYGADFGVATTFSKGSEVEIIFAGVSAKYDFDKQTATLQLGDWSLGDMIARFTSWLVGRPVALDPPWSLLNDVNLKDFVLTIDVRNESVSLKYPSDRDLGINLGFIAIESIALAYNPKDENNGVYFELGVSSFIGVYPDEKSNDRKALGWDPTKGPGPSVPGFGSEFLDLRLLALGQHVSFSDSAFDSVEEVIQGLKALPPPSGDKLPVSATPPKGQPRFDSNSHWLIATDFGLMKLPGGDSKKPGYFLDLSVIFNDPDLYGLRLKLDGDMAKALEGLVFDVLYKKITDTLGVYEIELELPEAMRTLDFGAMSVTLPVIRLQIYTNGDFLIDLGFPHDKDFSQSFAFQALVPPGVPMIGAGGFYFGMLGGAAAPNLPATKEGNFNPVTAFGIGMQVGLGRRIDKGVFQADLTLVVVGIIEGTIATFRPIAAGAANVQYYWLQGTLGIVGTVHGYVDFKIIKAGVHIEVYAYVSATYEAFRAMPIDLIAGVTVKATVTINAGLFKVHLKFSFHTEIRQSLVIGEDSRAPWDDRKLQVRSRYALPPAADGLPGSAVLQFMALPPATKSTLRLNAVPITTIRNGAEDSLDDQVAALALNLLIDAPDSESDDSTGTSFELLCEELLPWAIASYVRQTRGGVDRETLTSSPISARDLSEVYTKLTERDGAALDTAAILDFLEQHFDVRIGILDERSNDKTVTVFPMLPPLSLHVPRGDGEAETVRDFSSFNPLSEHDVQLLEDYFRRLQIQSEQPAANGGKPLSAAEPGESTSAAALLFEDYFRMLLRHLVQSALETLRHYRHPLEAGQSLADIHEWARTSAGSDVTLQELFESTRTLVLDAGKGHGLTLDAHSYQAVDGDTLADVLDKAPGKLLGSIAQANAKRQNLLRPGAMISFGSRSHTVTLFDDLERVAGNLDTDVDTLAADPAVRADKSLLLPHGVWLYPGIELGIQANDTLETVAGRAAVTVTRLANATNAGTADLFAVGEGVTIDIPHLQTLPLDRILADFGRNKVLTNLSGLAARNALHGLRLPAPADLKSGKDRALYEFSGQQVDLPVLEKGTDYALRLSRAAGAAWIAFDGDEDSLSIPLHDDDIDRINGQLAGARSDGIRPGVTYIGASPRYRDLPTHYPMQTNLPWHAGGEIRLPSQPDKAADSQNLRLWPLPPALLALGDATAGTYSPGLEPKLGVRNEADGSMSVANVVGYGWATRVRFAIRRLAGGDGDSADVYAVQGADYHGVRLLEAILTTSAESTGLSIDATRILYTPGVESDRPSMLLSGAGDKTRWFVTRVNLSNRTQPDTDRVAAAAPGTVLGTAEQNIRSLWEASITRSGGCYLYYSDQDSSSGLPDNLFDSEGRAQLELLITYEKPSGQLNRLAPYINTLISADPVDASKAVVFAEIASESLSITCSAGDSLASLAAHYHSDPTRILADNASQPFATNTIVSLRDLVYLTRPHNRAPGCKLPDIAAYFGVEESAIRALNPDIGDFDNIPPLTALVLPEIRHTATSGDTAASISEHYGARVDAIATENAWTTGLFGGEAQLTVATGPFDRHATLRAGEIGFDVIRNKPAADASVAATLDNLYQYLGFNIESNACFEASMQGMPVGPVEADRDSDDHADQWRYRVVFRYSDYVRSTATGGHAGPNVYAGIGKILQPRFEWRDPLGNRAVTPLNHPDLDTTSPLNRPPVRIGYTDRLLGVGEWPAVSASYSIAKGQRQPVLQVALQFDPSPYRGEHAADRAGHDLATWARVLQQLEDRNPDESPAVDIAIEATLRTGPPVPISAAERQALVTWVGRIRDYLQAVAAGARAAPTGEWACRQALESTDLVTASIVELQVALSLARGAQRVDPSFSAVPSVYLSRMVLPPRAAKGNEQNLVSLAQSIEDIFRVDDEWCWKLATGRGQGGGSGRKVLWLVRFDLGSGSGVRLDLQPEPTSFAVPPLATTMQSAAGVAIYRYDTQTGIDWNAQPKMLRLDGIDLDRWGDTFLSAFDQVLSPDNAAKIAMIDRADTAPAPPMHQLLEAKKRLAAAIAGRVRPILENAGSDSRALAAAQERVRQELMVQLNAAYAPQIAVHFRGQVMSGSSGEKLRAYGVYQPANRESTNRSFSLDAAKAELVSDGGSESELVFLLTVASARSQRSVELNGGYRITHIEHEIHQVKGIKDYEASSWLSFVIPNDPTVVSSFAAAVEVPIPLREYPVEATLDGQASARSFPNARNLSQVTDWDFAARYAVNQTAQDELLIKVRFNVKSMFGARSTDRTLLGDLAQFNDTWPQLKADIATALSAIDAQTDAESPEMSHANVTVSAFADLAERIAGTWESHEAAAVSAVAAESVTCQITETAGEYRLKKGVLIISLDSTSNRYGVQPGIQGYLAKRIDTAGNETRFAFFDAKDSTKLLTWEAARAIPQRELWIRRLDVRRYQSAWASIALIRNQHLVADKTVTTDDAFIYRTPDILFPQPLLPTLAWDTQYDIAKIDSQRSASRKLADHLDAMMDALIETGSDDKIRLQGEVRYSYPIGDGLPSAELPILYIPGITYSDAASKSRVGAGLAGSIANWQTTMNPVRKGACYQFDITLLSSPDLTERPHPSLRVSNCVLYLADIADL